MTSYYFFYQPPKAAVQVAIIPAQNIKQALTRFNSAGFEGEIECIKKKDFDNKLINF